MAEEPPGGGGEKVHDPTPQRLEEARRKGDVPKSADLAAAAAYLALLAALGTAGAWAVAASGEAMAGLLGGVDRLEGRMLGPGGPALSAQWTWAAAGPLMLFVVAPMVAALTSYVAERAVVAAPEKLQPKLSRISIVSNAKQKYGLTGLAQFAKSAVKLAAICLILTLYLLAETDRLAAMVRSDPRAAGPEMGRLAVGLLSVIAVVAVAIAVFDVLWQRFDHARKLKMSFQDLKEENKKSEGDPHMKGERTRRARAIATNRMLAEVPKSDVVIVNPTHYAVALKWSRKPGSAPVCVAKGVDEVALAIRARAAEAGVPVRSDPPTARALHATVDLGAEIGHEHYRAVAAAIRWAEKMRALARARGWGG